tara:strand:+ start:2611 stop:2982 length:372 start_codon:yes stop_codon:yes gene_type:complete
MFVVVNKDNNSVNVALQGLDCLGLIESHCIKVKTTGNSKSGVAEFVPVFESDFTNLLHDELEYMKLEDFINQKHVLEVNELPMTSEQRNTAVKWYAENWSIETIAQEFGLHVEDMKKALHNNH